MFWWLFCLPFLDTGPRSNFFSHEFVPSNVWLVRSLWTSCFCRKTHEQKCCHFASTSSSQLLCSTDSFEEQLAEAVRKSMHLYASYIYKDSQKEGWKTKMETAHTLGNEETELWSFLRDRFVAQQQMQERCRDPGGKKPTSWCMLQLKGFPGSCAPCISWAMKGVRKSKCPATMWPWVDCWASDGAWNNLQGVSDTISSFSF